MTLQGLHSDPLPFERKIREVARLENISVEEAKRLYHEQKFAETLNGTPLPDLTPEEQSVLKTIAKTKNITEREAESLLISHKDKQNKVVQAALAMANGAPVSDQAEIDACLKVTEQTIKTRDEINARMQGIPNL